MTHLRVNDDTTLSTLKPLSPLAAAVEAASLENVALFAIAVNRRERERETSLRSHTPILTAPSLPSQLPPPLPSS